MTPKEALLELVRDMDAAEAAHFYDLIRWERENPPEPLTVEMRAAIERGLADVRAGRLIDQEEVERELGLA
jgi:hypothetical protein